MTLAIRQTSIAHPPEAKGRHSNFGSLVSAIVRGDIDTARNAFSALSEAGAKAPGPLRNGSLDAMGKALEAGDLTEAKKALKQLQQGRLATTTTTETPAAATGLTSDSTVNILV